MKKFFFIILILLSKSLYSQNNKIDSLPPAFDDYSNKKKVDISVMYNEYLKVKENTIIVIDNKILRINDKKFTELDKSKVTKIEVIKDEESKSDIKYIILITTKKEL